MECVNKIDTFVVRVRSRLESIGTIKYNIARCRPHSRHLEKRTQRHPRPLADRTPAFDTIMAVDFYGSRPPPTIFERPNNEAANTARAVQTPLTHNTNN